MAEPTLTEVFGAGATQTATQITILKADLPGLTASANNTAESLLVGVLLKAKQKLTTASYDANIEQGITITTPDFNAQSLVTRNNAQYRQYIENVNFYKLDNSTALDPDDF